MLCYEKASLENSHLSALYKFISKFIQIFFNPTSRKILYVKQGCVELKQQEEPTPGRALRGVDFNSTFIQFFYSQLVEKLYMEFVRQGYKFKEEPKKFKIIGRTTSGRTVQ